tara:strand:+ start:1278 stop:1478 length:201 start_codon:yes stop_codon:yes gene_type:complete
MFVYPNFSPFVLSDSELLEVYKSCCIQEQEALEYHQWNGSKWVIKYPVINLGNVRRAFVEYVLGLV